VRRVPESLDRGAWTSLDAGLASPEGRGEVCGAREIFLALAGGTKAMARGGWQGLARWEGRGCGCGGGRDSRGPCRSEGADEGQRDEARRQRGRALVVVLRGDEVLPRLGSPLSSSHPHRHHSRRHVLPPCHPGCPLVRHPGLGLDRASPLSLSLLPRPLLILSSLTWLTRTALADPAPRFTSTGAPHPGPGCARPLNLVRQSSLR